MTPTVIASNGVDADRVLAANVARALIDVLTADERVPSEAGPALAYTYSGSTWNALCVASTLTFGNSNVHFALGAAFIRVAGHAVITVALVWEAIGAVAVGSAARGAEGRQDGRHAQEVPVSHKPFPAETLARFAVTCSIEAT